MMEEQWGITLEEWNQHIDKSAYSIGHIAKTYCMQSLPKWLRGERIPNKKSKAKVEEVLVNIKEAQRIPYSPVWGFATPEQIERLKQSIPEQERERIMEQIRKQTKLRGKVN